MNIESTTAQVSQVKSNNNTQNSSNTTKNDGDFSKELQALSKPEKDDVNANQKEKVDSDDKTVADSAKEDANSQIVQVEMTDNVEGALNGLEGVVEQMSKLNCPDEFDTENVKLSVGIDDNDNKEDVQLIDNNMSIQEPNDKLKFQMNANMNFDSQGQQFSELLNADNNKKELKASSKDLAEEQEILSTIDENIAIANKNMAMSKNKTITNDEGVKRVDKNTNITVETIVSYDKVIMDKSDVDFFVNLVENGEIDLKNVQHADKSSNVSKTLADLIAKSMNDNKPIRIDFDNNISVIIKITREGKISADFLPSSQIAEAYLKENLPLLKQRFDDNNIDYGELNQRKQQKQESDNKKKGRKDE